MSQDRLNIRLLCLMMILLFALVVTSFIACSDDDDDDSSADDDDDTTTDDDDDNDDDDVESICTEITFDMHDSTTGWAFVNLTTLAVEMTEPDSYDFKIGHLATKAESIPCILLGENVGGINLGNDPIFNGVVQAPESGYEIDDGDDYVIGITWQQGGSGPSGWIMTDNVYALHLADGTYAKFSVTSAQAGIFTFSAFRQADGTRDMVCSWMK